jgi:hypothetical protein
MLLGTYNNFNTEMQAWMGRTDTYLTSRFDTFIGAAENRLFNGYGEKADPLFSEPLRCQAMEVTTQLEFTAPSGTATLPSDFLEARAVYINGTTVGGPSPGSAQDNTTQPTFEPAQRFFEETKQTAWGVPITFTVTGNTITVAAGWAGELTLVYMQRPPAVTNAAQSNPLSLAYPYAWFWAIMIEAQEWERNDDEAARHVRKLRPHITALNNAARRAKRGAPTQAQMRIDPIHQPSGSVMWNVWRT